MKLLSKMSKTIWRLFASAMTQSIKIDPKYFNCITTMVKILYQVKVLNKKQIYMNYYSMLEPKVIFNFECMLVHQLIQNLNNLFVLMSLLLRTSSSFRFKSVSVGMVIKTENKFIKKMSSNNSGSCLDKILADVSKQSATKQILIGAASGWYSFQSIYQIIIWQREWNSIQFFPLNRATGFASAKIGRLAAFTIGGAIILLEVANEQGIIKIDWSRLYRKVDEAGDKVQEKLTGEGPKWMDKVSLLFAFAHKCSSFYIFHKKKQKKKSPKISLRQRLISCFTFLQACHTFFSIQSKFSAHSRPNII